MGERRFEGIPEPGLHLRRIDRVLGEKVLRRLAIKLAGVEVIEAKLSLIVFPGPREKSVRCSGGSS
jgi:hypothetical protein